MEEQKTVFNEAVILNKENYWIKGFVKSIKLGAVVEPFKNFTGAIRSALKNLIMSVIFNWWRRICFWGAEKEEKKIQKA